MSEATNDSVAVVQALWERIQMRDWTGLGALLSPELRVDWPVTGERFVGPQNFVAVQSEYPEGWTIRVRRIFGDGEQVVSEVDVPHVDLGLSSAVSFWTVRDGVVVAGREYWTSPGSEQPPPWRRRFAQPSDRG